MYLVRWLVANHLSRTHNDGSPLSIGEKEKMTHKFITRFLRSPQLGTDLLIYLSNLIFFSLPKMCVSQTLLITSLVIRTYISVSLYLCGLNFFQWQSTLCSFMAYQSKYPLFFPLNLLIHYHNLATSFQVQLVLLSHLTHGFLCFKCDDAVFIVPSVLFPHRIIRSWIKHYDQSFLCQPTS